MSTAIDLSQVPAPDVIEDLGVETVLADLKAAVIAVAPDLEAVLALESEPVVKVLETVAYRELLLRARVNDAARAVMLAHATGGDLGNLAALFGVLRLELEPGDPDAVPPVDPTLESDTDLRRRAALAVEGYSTAGPRDAYIIHALSADADVLDADAQSPTPGDVLVSVLSRTGDSTADPALVATVLAALNADDTRPLCTNVVVQSAAIVTYQITATITCYPGPDRTVILAAAQAAAEAYAAAQHRIGRDVTQSGIYAALHQPGVQHVALDAPAADIVIGDTEASWCTAIALTDGAQMSDIRQNLFLWSEDFTQPLWDRNQIEATGAAGVASDGLPAFWVEPTAALGFHYQGAELVGPRRRLQNMIHLPRINRGDRHARFGRDEQVAVQLCRPRRAGPRPASAAHDPAGRE